MTEFRRDECSICRTLAAIDDRACRSFINELDEACVVLGENQGCRGWCVLLLKDHVEHLAELDVTRQSRVFKDVARVAGAIRGVFPASGAGGGPPRINYECLGNMVAHVHWHVIPRHADDPEPKKPVWGWPEERLRGSMTEGERRELVERLREKIGSGSE